MPWLHVSNKKTMTSRASLILKTAGVVGDLSAPRVGLLQAFTAEVAPNIHAWIMCKQFQASWL